MPLPYEAVPVDGERLQEERRLKKFTLKKLARAAGISMRQIQLMEAGGSASPRASIAPVARVFGIHWKCLTLNFAWEPDEPEFIPDFPVYIVGLHVDKDFDDLCEKDDVKPLADTLCLNTPTPRRLHYIEYQPFILYTGMKPLESALLEFEMDEFQIWNHLIPILGSNALAKHNVTGLYLPVSYVEGWKGAGEDYGQGGGVLPFSKMLRLAFGESFPVSVTTLDDGTVVLTPREVVPSGIRPI